MVFNSDHKLNGSPITMFPQRTELSAFVDINRHGLHPDRKISETAMEHRMFAHAEKLEASGGEAIPERNEGYIIWQDEHLIEKAQTYDEATRKGKVVKRRHPEAKVEIQYGSVTEIARFHAGLCIKKSSEAAGTGLSLRH